MFINTHSKRHAPYCTRLKDKCPNPHFRDKHMCTRYHLPYLFAHKSNSTPNFIQENRATTYTTQSKSCINQSNLQVYPLYFQSISNHHKVHPYHAKFTSKRASKEKKMDTYAILSLEKFFYHIYSKVISIGIQQIISPIAYNKNLPIRHATIGRLQSYSTSKYLLNHQGLSSKYASQSTGHGYHYFQNCIPNRFLHIVYSLTIYYL